jgi:hypothetical protein
LTQGSIVRADHFPAFGKPFRNILTAQRCYSAGHIVSEAGLEDGLEGLLHFGGVRIDSQILVEISAGTHENRANARHGRYRVSVLQAFRSS